ncbi:uncharacterized protein [Gossypium hirsutum]|uniref:Uncharacterized protein n=1 Tax=Gossypium hirsutum TaxID=3635 RepID=A0ABM2ZMH6_GOSHI|nr:uncharacterized protein LOC121214400 [Gossypium hirsutum]
MGRSQPRLNDLDLSTTSLLQNFNGMHDEYISLLSNDKELVRNKNGAALRKLSHQQVEEFMSEWNHSYVKTFRINCEFSILRSLSDRQLSNNGRIEFRDDDREIL